MVNRGINVRSEVVQVQIFKYFLAGQIEHVQEELALVSSFQLYKW